MSYRFALRMPRELALQISEMADKDKRAINTTIVMLLEYAVREKNRKRGKKVHIQHNPTNEC